jgi:hypothetical protein
VVTIDAPPSSPDVSSASQPTNATRRIQNMYFAELRICCSKLVTSRIPEVVLGGAREAGKLPVAEA